MIPTLAAGRCAPSASLVLGAALLDRHGVGTPAWLERVGDWSYSLYLTHLLLGTEDGTNLVQGYKRAANILRAERKKGDLPKAGSGAFTAPEAAALSDALAGATPKIDAALEAGDYPATLDALAGLSAPIDAFFEGVMVNSDDAAERARRLGLLVAVEDAFGRIADFSRLDG